MTSGSRVRSGAITVALALVVLPASASAKGPRVFKGPAVYTGTIEGFTTQLLVGQSPVTDTWRVTGLKLKRSKTLVTRRGQKQRIYKVVDGAATWTHEHGGCPGLSFTETFSLKNVRWSSDSYIVFFAPSKGRHKNRWRVTGSLYTPRERSGTCNGFDSEIGIPGLVSGPEVDELPPIAKPGKKVELVFDPPRRALDDKGSYEESNNKLVIRPG